MTKVTLNWLFPVSQECHILYVQSYPIQGLSSPPLYPGGLGWRWHPLGGVGPDPQPLQPPPARCFSQDVIHHRCLSICFQMLLLSKRESAFSLKEAVVQSPSAGQHRTESDTTQARNQG